MVKEEEVEKLRAVANKFRTVDGEEEYEEGEDDYEDEGEPEGDEGEDPEPEGEDPSGSVNHINQMTMCIRGKSKTSSVAASSSSTERVGSESHRVDEINLVEKFQSIDPESRGQLVRASQHLLRFLLAGHVAQNDFMHAETLLHVFRPLVELPDRHLLASAVGLTLALITGRTDLCSAGVFGAGKTRAAAAVIVGLIAIDPTLSIMICTKETAAAQAVAEHIVSMQLPENLLCKFGRLIGFHEAQKGASARTAIDVGSLTTRLFTSMKSAFLS